MVLLNFVADKESLVKTDGRIVTGNCAARFVFAACAADQWHEITQNNLMESKRTQCEPNKGEKENY